MIVLNALSMDKPVVVTDVGDLRELVEGLDAGGVADKIGDIDQLCALVRQCLAKPAEPGRIRRQLIERFDAAKSRSQYLSALLPQGRTT